MAGDVMNSMTPDMGQGGALALEESVILGKCLTEVDLDKSLEIEVTLKKYVEKRKESFWNGVGSSISRIVQSGSWWLPKLVREKVVFNKLSPKMLHHTEYDCGTLPTLS
ncbi:hypothetical protein SUGI_0938520 [Cryptomeria japonica]|nr:hypothetical protein SUGI_0938520 [Cryptomeria japonica]